MLTSIPYRTMLKSAIQTVICLFGGLFIGAFVANTLFNALPGHSIDSPNALHILLATIPAIIGLIIGSALWGIQMGRLVQVTESRRMAFAGVLGFTPVTVALGLLLNVLEPIAVERFGSQMPIHRLFTLLFVPSVFISAGVSAWAIGVGLRNIPLARLLSWRVGLAAALGFLAANIFMEALGWIVGGPFAAERFTMLTVMFIGHIAGTLMGGAVLGWILNTTSIRSVSSIAVSSS